MEGNYGNKVKAIGYIRAAANGPSSENSLLEQTSKIRAAGVNTIVCDFASASDTDRPGLKILLKLVKEGEIRDVVITRWDRLTRCSNFYSELFDTFSSLNVSLRLLDQGNTHFPNKESDLWDFLNAIYQRQNC